VGGNISELLSGYFSDAQEAMEKEFSRSTLKDLLDGLKALRKRKESRRTTR
jgi:hypothetical protein